MDKKQNNVVLYVVLVLFGGALLYNFVINNNFNRNLNNRENKREIKEIIVRDNGLANAVAKSYDATVMVMNFASGVNKGNGSGFIYKKDKEHAYILTNYHVIEGADKLIVKTTTKEEEATLLGSDKFLDLAVLRFSSKNVKYVAELGKSNELKLGDLIFTVGTPVGGEFFNTVTSGIMSGIDRQITVSIETKNDFILNVLQMDASINPGNSGGPLLNNKGQVVGINSLKLVDNQVEGMGFAIKIEDAIAHLDDFGKGRKIKRPALGIRIVDTRDKAILMKEGINLSNNIKSGVVVVIVDDNSSAKAAGLIKGDVITKVEKYNVDSTAHLKYLLYKYKPNDKIKLTIIRNNIEKEISIKLGQIK